MQRTRYEVPWRYTLMYLCIPKINMQVRVSEMRSRNAFGKVQTKMFSTSGFSHLQINS